MKISLEGQHVLITGATGGLGREITRTLFKTKCKITAVSRDLGRLQKLQQEVSINYRIDLFFLI